MNQRHNETEVPVVEEMSTLDSVLKSFWDKVHSASELIQQLREEKKILKERSEELEQQVSSLRQEVVTRDHELKRLRAEHAQLLSANGNNTFTPQEREEMKSRVRDIISKINSYL